MTTTDNFEFDNEFYNFDNANEFLQNISGAVSSLSPLSEDERFRNSIGDVDSNWYTEGINQNDIFRNKAGDNFNLINQEYTNPSINNGSGENDYFIETKKTDMKAPNNLLPSSMSSGTYSQDSTNNGMTPLSQPSLTSTHTSPESLVKIEENEDTGGRIKGSSTSKNAKVTKPQKKDKSSHNMIEKKYRTNINSKIVALRDAVPSLKIVAGNNNVSISDLEGLTPASKLNKASVLTKATEYIKHLEHKNDMLKQQNTQLQKLIQEANVQSQPMSQEQALPPHRGGFGFVPPQGEQSFNSTPVQQNFSGDSFNFNNQNTGMSIANPSYNYNKVLLGSLATVMGTSLIADNASEFKGLSALPFSSFLPYFVTHPSPITIQLWSLLKILLVLGSMASLVLPSLLIAIQNDKQSDQGTIDIWKFWLFNSLGLRLPHPFEQGKVDNILFMLSGKSDQEFSWASLFNYYIYLASCETTFELCILNLIVGTMLSVKFPLLSKFINRNMSLKGSLLLNLDYKGDNKSLIKLHNLIRNLDGISMLGSTSLFTRLINIAEHKSINNNIYDGQNNIKYAELFQENEGDYYNTIVTWRILEITHELNLAYLKNMASKSQEKSKVFNQISEDLKKIEAILLNDATSSLKSYFTLFKSVIEERSALSLLERIETDVNSSLSTFENIKEESELVEDDVSDFSEDDHESDQPTNYFDETEQPKTSTIRSNKSLICSLNLVSEEQFIVLTSSLILYYQQHQKAKSNELLRYLNFSSEKSSLSLLSFTALLKVITELIGQDQDANDFTNSNVLDKLIRITRLWINDDKKQFLDYNLRCDLSDLIVSKGSLLNGALSDESDEEGDDD